MPVSCLRAVLHLVRTTRNFFHRRLVRDCHHRCKFWEIRDLSRGPQESYESCTEGKHSSSLYWRRRGGHLDSGSVMQARFLESLGLFWGDMSYMSKDIDYIIDAKWSSSCSFGSLSWGTTLNYSLTSTLKMTVNIVDNSSRRILTFLPGLSW